MATPSHAQAVKSLNKCPGHRRFVANSHDVFDIDNDDDSEDSVMLSEEVSKSNKGKAIEAIHQVVNASDNTVCQLTMENFGNGYHMVSHSSISVDGHGSNLSCVHGDDSESEDLVILGEQVIKSNKGKTIEAIHQEVSDYTFCKPVVKSFGSVAQDVIYIDDDEDDDSDDLMIIGDNVSKSNKRKTIEVIPKVVARLNNVDIATPNKRKSIAATTSANSRRAKKARLNNVDISMSPAVTKTVSGKKATGSGSKNSQVTRSSKTSRSLDSGALMSSSLFSQSVSFKKKSNAPMRLITASKPPAATKAVSGKKVWGSGSKNSQVTSFSNIYNWGDPEDDYEDDYEYDYEDDYYEDDYEYDYEDDYYEDDYATSSSTPSLSLNYGAPWMKIEAAPKASNSKVTMGNIGHSYGTGLSSTKLPKLEYKWQVL